MVSNPLQPNPPHPMVNIVFCVKLIFLIHPHNTVVLRVSAAQCARVTHIMLGKSGPHPSTNLLAALLF